MDLWQILYLIAPLVVGGVVHSIVIHRDLLARLASPIDGGHTLRGEPILGPNKTWRGVIVMAIATPAATGVERALERIDAVAAFAPLHSASWLALGFVMALGYSLGELPNSFVKRRRGIAAGGRSGRSSAVQYVVDQADSAIGVAIALACYPGPPIADLLAIAVVGTAVHALFDLMLHTLGVKRRTVTKAQPRVRTG